ncbi:MAG: hypothetical protein AAB421_02860 [Patescibacteria group bacterium]
MTYVMELHPESEPSVAVVAEAKKLGRSAGPEIEGARLAKELGLTQIATRFSEREPTKNRIAALEHLGLRRVSDQEYAVWAEFLPTGYWSDSSKAIGAGSRSFADYNFKEGVPTPVLARIAQIKDIVSTVEIRTPEKMVYPDPVAFAHVVGPMGERTIFMVARWAESAVDFVKDVGDVKAVLRARRGLGGGWFNWSDEEVDTVMFVGIFLMTLSAFAGWAIFLTVGLVAGVGSALAVHGFSIGALLPILGLIGNKVNRMWRKYRLAQTNPHLARMV